MQNKINESSLCVLKYQEESELFVIDYLPIEKLFEQEIKKLVSLCVDQRSDVEDIITYLQGTLYRSNIQGAYGYCEYLGSAYQGVLIDIHATIKEIKEKKDLYLSQEKKNPQIYNYNDRIGEYKDELKNKFQLWGKAYSIEHAYRNCRRYNAIKMYSHRERGWSNPVYRLTDNFSIEIKTNFGFGRSSYFFTKMKYKDIELTPFSEWIDYEKANYSEIIRYTQSYHLTNSSWQRAMEYAKDACNLSMTSEQDFILKYVIGECEKMTKGLQNILKRTTFTFKKKEKSGSYKVDKEGHFLMEFRGEKISGALDFIAKIFEYKEIAEVGEFVTRIEKINQEIKPSLENELNMIEKELALFGSELEEKTPEYERLGEQNKIFMQKRSELRAELIETGVFPKGKVDQNELTKLFQAKFPDYLGFKERYDIVHSEYDSLKRKIWNLEDLSENIETYTNKIEAYFNAKEESVVA